MKYLDLLKSSARQATTSKLFWLYLGATFILSIISPTKPLVYVNWFLAAIASLILIAGLVHAVSQKEFYQLDVPVPDSLRMGWSKFIPVGLINIFFLILFFVLFRPIGFLLNQFIPSKQFLALSFTLFLRPIMVFSTCAIIINNVSIGRSAWASVMMFLKNSFEIIAMSGVFLIIQHVFLGIVVLLMFISPSHEKVMSSNGGMIPYFKMLEIPEIIFWGQVFFFIIYPWIVITFTKMYIRFVNTSEYLGMSSHQEAA